MKTSSLPPLCSIPFFAFKEKVNDSDQCQHQCPCKDITISPSQFRHPLEIHSPDTCQKGQWKGLPKLKSCRGNRLMMILQGKNPFFYFQIIFIQLRGRYHASTDTVPLPTSIIIIFLLQFRQVFKCHKLPFQFQELLHVRTDGY